MHSVLAICYPTPTSLSSLPGAVRAFRRKIFAGPVCRPFRAVFQGVVRLLAGFLERLFAALLTVCASGAPPTV